MIERLLRYWADRLPAREINAPDGAHYMRRYYVGGVGDSIHGIHCYLHEYLAPDPGRDLHDHPFRWSIGIPLVGWYIERRFKWIDPRRANPVTTYVRRIRRFRPNYIPASAFHRIEIVAHGTWTIFIRGPRTKWWGFLRGVDVVTGDPESTGVNWWKNAPLGKDIPR